MTLNRSEIFLRTEYSTGNSIEKPIRIILHENKGGFVSHMQDREGNCFYGHYSTNFEHAKREFIRRVNRHNEMFPKGNPSYVGDVIGDD